MNALQQYKRWLLFATCAIFISCSGGEGGTGVTTPPPASDISMGTITQFGSIFVNGVEFDTTNTEITIDDLTGSNAELRLGMFVTVSGTINPDGITGVADSVSVEESIKGKVESKTGTDTLTIMGQTVHVPASARFDNVFSFSGISVGNVVEVSGYVKSDGLIFATRVELLSPLETDSKLFGVVKNLDTSAKTFQFGTLNINYSSASFKGISPADLSNDMFIEAEGTYDAGFTVLNAAEIEKEVIKTSSSNEVELEGFVTSAMSASEFTVNNFPVMTDINTDFDGGLPEEIVPGMFVEVEGYINNGVLMANEVEFGDDTRIEANIESVNTSLNTITFKDMSGFSVQVNAFTEYSSDLPNGISDLLVDDSIKVRGYLIEATSTVIARRIDKQSPTANISLQGQIVNTPAYPVLDIMGINIDTTGFASNAFTKEETVLTPEEFFANIEPGKIVNANGTITGSVITWSSLEIISD